MSESSVPRRYATLGKTPEHTSHIGQLCNAIRTSDRHEFIKPAGSGETTEPGDWRLLAEDDRIEAVIVCAHDEATLDAALTRAITAQMGTPPPAGIVVSIISRKGDWRYGTVAVRVPDHVEGSPESFVFVALKDKRGWAAALQRTATFDRCTLTLICRRSSA